MKLNETRKNWEKLARLDPLYGVASSPDKMGGKWDEKQFFDTGTEQIDGLFQYAKSIGVSILPGRALDFGCGVGRLSLALAKHFDSVTGVDISATMIERAKEYDKSGGKCNFVLNEKEDISMFADSTFDFVFTDMVLQHMDTAYALKYIAEFVRVVKKGGIVAFQFPVKMQYSRARLFIKKIVPKSLIILYRKIRYRGAHIGDLEIEMNGVNAGRVLDVLEGAGAKVIDHKARYYWATK